MTHGPLKMNLHPRENFQPFPFLHKILTLWLFLKYNRKVCSYTKLSPFLTYQTISQAVYHTLKWGDIGHYSNALHNNIILSVFFWFLLTSFWRLWRFFRGRLTLKATCFSMTTFIWGVSWFYFFKLWMTVSTAFWEVCLVRFHFVWGLYLNWGWINVMILLLILDIIKRVHVG